MRVRHIMSNPVVSVTTGTPVPEAAKLMKDKNIRRLLVIDAGKLQGIITKDRVLKASPSTATTLSLYEARHILGRLTVGDIMRSRGIEVEQRERWADSPGEVKHGVRELVSRAA